MAQHWAVTIMTARPAPAQTSSGVVSTGALSSVRPVKNWGPYSHTRARLVPAPTTALMAPRASSGRAPRLSSPKVSPSRLENSRGFARGWGGGIGYQPGPASGGRLMPLMLRPGAVQPVKQR